MLSKKIETELLKICEHITIGRLHLTTPDGQNHSFGNSGEIEADIHIHDWATLSMAMSRGDIGFGEAYVLGHWESTAPAKLITLLLKNEAALSSVRRPNALNKLKFRFIDQILRRNSQSGSSSNIRSHYDVGNEFYMEWLDDTMTYSSAIFDGAQDLRSAQHRKYDRILERLGSKGERILEVGCGWGGFADRASQKGFDVTGITLSHNQKAWADARLDGRAKIELRDYRNTKGKFDHIVSIEMIEAVGEKYWPTYFGTLRDRLTEGGKAVIQAITIPNEAFAQYRKSSDFIRHYTFPGGMLLTTEQIEKAAKSQGLTVTNTFAFGQDYGRTCQIWSEQMMRRSEKIRKLGYDDKFLRSWRYYLDACTASFAVGQSNVVQVELQHG